MPRSKGRLTLPDNPSLEQLREQAKERLVIIRGHAPEAQLSDAQFALARDYGFAGWRALKEEVDRRSGGAASGLAGHYTFDDVGVRNSVSTVTARGDRLFLEQRGGTTTEIIRQADGAFTTPGLSRRYRFERDQAGKASALIIETDTGAAVRAPRISAEKAARMRAARDDAASRISGKDWAARMPIAVSEAALDRCTGTYADPFGGVLAFTREGGSLFMGAVNQTKVSLAAASEVDFFQMTVRMEFHFRLDGDVATSVIHRRLGTEVLLSRVSADEAARLNATVARRAAEQAEPRQVAPVSADILARYAGRYRIENGLEIAIAVEEGRIFAQVGFFVQQPRREIFPESDSKFFWTTMAAQINFFTDAEGKVSHAVWHQGGHLIAMSRIDDPPAAVAPAA